ncbi:hypothetical protein EN781_00130 [Mesorhizobium sp. M4A.F.Ca.ET.090.04.2.1]|uniref:hypothetical protein n=1 Tax=Mesorhizobium sp. M4A.F.Ca.ET.090.04.2.1 TaxID=2496663 RepID=UPI000FCB8518|nr:hypothetical protein [Mesorhizobium sp. M4A.F.Ca.ET.090.04.2.1]RVC47579.1 hypothetical protein EN781_00130 [Mesorhizobium sp. M4A.F.Ca.ET.090.04.2.1]
MSAPSLDGLLPGLRAAIIANTAIANLHGLFNGEPSVHTRRPIPADAVAPSTVIGPIAALLDGDGLSDYRPTVSIDISTYGEQSKDLRTVDSIAEKIRLLFHRQPQALTVNLYKVVMIRARGPVPAPVDDDTDVGRRVTLTIDLFAQP